MNLSPQLELIGRDLDAAVRRMVARRQRRRRVVHVVAAALGTATLFSAAAAASGIGPDLQLDPTKWTILHRGDVDEGKAAYAHVVAKADGAHSLFMVEHDAGMDRYQAFLLHERVVDAGNAAEAASGVVNRIEPGDLCTAQQLTKAELVALATLRSTFAAGASADATKQVVDAAVGAAFASTPCRGLEYASEQARLVYAGTQPLSMLMPGAR